MSEQEKTEYPEIRIPKIDELLEENAKLVSNIMSSDMTEEEEEYLKVEAEDLEKDLMDVQEIINQTLDYLQNKGCDVWKHL